MPRSRYPELTRRIGLSRYQGPSGIGAKEAQRTMDIISNNLDMMSKYFFKKAGVRAEIEAEKFGAENTPTLDDYKKSIALGENPLDQYDRTTIFGKTAFNTVAKNLSNTLLINAKNQMNNVALTADHNMSSATDLSNDLNAIVLENIKLANEISPSVATQIASNLNITASGHYYKHGLKLNKQSVNFIQSQTSNLLNTNLDNMDKDIYAGLEKDKNLTVKELTEKLYGKEGIKTKLKARHAQLMLGAKFGRTAFEKGLEDWDKEWVKSVGSMVSTLSFNSDKKISDITGKLIKGKEIGDPQIDALVAGLDFEDRFEIAKQIRAVHKSQLELEDKIEEETDEVNNAEIANLEVKINKDIIEGADASIITSDLAKLKGLVDPDDSDNEWVKLSNLFYKSGGRRTVSDPLVYEDFRKKSDIGSLTFKELNTKIKELSRPDYEKLSQKIVQTSSDNFKDAMVFVAGELKFSPGQITLSETHPNFKKQEVYKEIRKKLLLEEIGYNKVKFTKDKPFDYIDRAKKLVAVEGEILLTKMFEEEKKTGKLFLGFFKKVYPEVFDGEIVVNRVTLEKVKDKLKDIISNEDLRKGEYKKEMSRNALKTIIKKLLDNERLE